MLLSQEADEHRQVAGYVSAEKEEEEEEEEKKVSAKLS